MPIGEIMDWKNMKQPSLANSILVDHDVVKELDFVQELIDWARLEHHLKIDIQVLGASQLIRTKSQIVGLVLSTHQVP